MVNIRLTLAMLISTPALGVALIPHCTITIPDFTTGHTFKLILVTLSLFHDPIIFSISFFFFLVQKSSLDSSCAYTAQSLESAISPRNVGSFQWGRTKTKI